MGRFFVLCLLFIPVFFLPGNASALINGQVWATGALNSALDPSAGPPEGLKPSALFTVPEVNFSSILAGVTFDAFLGKPDWNEKSFNNFKPSDPMFTSTAGTGKATEGIFFRFEIPLTVTSKTMPITIIYDDGFAYYLISEKPIQEVIGIIEKPLQLTFPANADPGEYFFANLNFGALNDTDSHTIIFRTPEPGTLLLLGLGLIVVGILRRRG